MPHRRRHGRDRRALHPEPRSGLSRPERKTAKDSERRAAELRIEESQSKRRRDVIALLALPVLFLVLGCETVPIPFACDLPREVRLLSFSAIFGAWLGMTIRMVRERRRHAREVRPSTS